MVDAFMKRVSTKEGFDKELHVIQVKMAVGVLHNPEDSYMWPYIVGAWEKFADDASVRNPS